MNLIFKKRKRVNHPRTYLLLIRFSRMDVTNYKKIFFAYKSKANSVNMQYIAMTVL